MSKNNDKNVFISNAEWTIFRDDVIRNIYNKIKDLDLKVFTNNCTIA